MDKQHYLRVSNWPLLVLGAVLAAPAVGFSQQSPADHPARHPATAAAVVPLTDQVADLQAKVSKLQEAMQQKQAGMSPSAGMPGQAGMTNGVAGAMPSSNGMASTGTPAMGQMGSMPGGGLGNASMGSMGMMSSEMGGMGSMSGGGSMPSGSGMMSMMGMMGMSPAAPGGMAMPTALPGFPGASHLYHIGSTGFFLDHGNHITLTVQQQTALSAAKEKAMLDKSSKQREIDAAEQELWTLTASDQPDAAQIEAKVQQIGTLNGNQRIAFIRAVGEAAKVLTDAQRQSLLGQQPPQNQNAQPAPAAPGAMPGMPAPAGGGGGGMGHM